VCGKARLEKEFSFDIDVKSRGILLASMPPIFRCPDVPKRELNCA
jgi:hypothetical protein